jgi:hypothetical protein
LCLKALTGNEEVVPKQEEGLAWLLRSVVQPTKELRIAVCRTISVLLQFLKVHPGAVESRLHPFTSAYVTLNGRCLFDDLQHQLPLGKFCLNAGKRLVAGSLQ